MTIERYDRTYIDAIGLMVDGILANKIEHLLEPKDIRRIERFREIIFEAIEGISISQSLSIVPGGAQKVRSLQILRDSLDSSGNMIRFSQLQIFLQGYLSILDEIIKNQKITQAQSRLIYPFLEYISVFTTEKHAELTSSLILHIG